MGKIDKWRSKHVIHWQIRLNLLYPEGYDDKLGDITVPRYP